MSDKYTRLRIVSPDGLAHTSTVFAVAPDGTESPIEDVVTKVELTCDANTGCWVAVLHVEMPAVDVVVDKIETRVAASSADVKEN